MTIVVASTQLVEEICENGVEISSPLGTIHADIW